MADTESYQFEHNAWLFDLTERIWRAKGKAAFMKHLAFWTNHRSSDFGIIGRIDYEDDDDDEDEPRRRASRIT